MKTTSYYPVLMTDDVAGTAGSIRRHFRFEALFESDWYVHLRSKEDKRVNLGIVQWDHESVPPAGRAPTRGLLINFEVRDPDAVYDALGPRNCRFFAACATRISASAISSPPIPMA